MENLFPELFGINSHQTQDFLKVDYISNFIEYLKRIRKLPRMRIRMFEEYTSHKSGIPVFVFKEKLCDWEKFENLFSDFWENICLSKSDTETEGILKQFHFEYKSNAIRFQLYSKVYTFEFQNISNGEYTKPARTQKHL